MAFTDSTVVLTSAKIGDAKPLLPMLNSQKFETTPSVGRLKSARFVATRKPPIVGLTMNSDWPMDDNERGTPIPDFETSSVSDAVPKSPGVVNMHGAPVTGVPEWAVRRRLRIMGPMGTLKEDLDSARTHKLAATSLPLPAPAARAIARLGADFGLARRRRRMTQQSLAERIGASLSTIKRIEAGDARVPLHFIARTLHVFGEIERLAGLLDTAQDPIGLTLMNEQLPQRVRSPRRTPGQGGL